MDVIAVREARRRGAPAGPRGEPADPARGLHLPLPRPLGRRPGGLPRARGGRGVAGERPDRDLRQALRRGGRARRARGRRRSATRPMRRSRRRSSSPTPRPSRRSTRLYENLYVLDSPRLVRGRRAQPGAAPRRARGRHARGGARAGRGGRRLRRAAGRAASEPGRARRRPGGNRARGRPAPRRGRGREDPRRRESKAEEAGLMATLRMREALRDAMAEEMRRDESVFVMGEDVGVFQGAFKVTEGLLDEFGERRVRDTPISENTIVGAGVGAAMGGLRPDRRADDRQLLAAGARPDRQPRRGDPLHVQRPGPGADGDPHARRRRAPARPDPLAQLRGPLPPGARACSSPAPPPPPTARRC